MQQNITKNVSSDLYFYYTTITVLSLMKKKISKIEKKLYSHYWICLGQLYFLLYDKIFSGSDHGARRVP